MPKFEVLLSETAWKELKHLDRKQQERIKKHLRELTTDPFRSRSKADIKKLSGSFDPELYCLRVGDYRIIYAIIENKVKITEIMRRGKGYSWLE